MACMVLKTFEETDGGSFLHVVIAVEVKVLQHEANGGKFDNSPSLDQIDHVDCKVGEVEIQQFGVEFRLDSVRFPAGSVRRARAKKEVDYSFTAITWVLDV